MFLKINVIHQMFWQKHIIYIFLANVTFYLQKWHKNTRIKIFVSLKQNN